MLNEKPWADDSIWKIQIGLKRKILFLEKSYPVLEVSSLAELIYLKLEKWAAFRVEEQKVHCSIVNFLLNFYEFPFIWSCLAV